MKQRHPSADSRPLPAASAQQDGAEPRSALLRGTLDLLILKALSLDPLHGVGVSKRIEQITGGEYRVSFGSLFPALHGMEEEGWVVAEWRASETNRRAKYYRLTAAGRRQFEEEQRGWLRTASAMALAMRAT